MPRQSVIAFRFVLEGAIPFDPADLDDYNRANAVLREIKTTMAPFGEGTMKAKVTTLRMAKEPRLSLRETLAAIRAIPMTGPDVSMQELRDGLRPADPTRGEIPPELERRS